MGEPTKDTFTIGTLVGQMDLVLQAQGKMQDDIAEIKDSLAERRGERRSVKAVAAAVSLAVGLGSSIVTFVVTHFGSPK
jgi:hypothetical protein